MLDLMKLAQQMQGISNHLRNEAEAAGRRVSIATKLMSQAQTRQTELVEQLEAFRDRIPFAIAQPIEPLNTRIDIQTAPEAHTVLATDGSQISPSHHEIAYCYLLNIGRVVLHYGQSRYPLLDSLPEVVYRPEDLHVSRQWGIRTEEWMGHRRTVSEAVALSELAISAHGDRFGTAPTLALTDGSLIYWFLEDLPGNARDRILPPILSAWDQLQAASIPLIGYVSASRSGEALNFLRLQSCPFETPDCLTHCAAERDRLPCQVFDPLRDVALWATDLTPGQRGPLYRSSANILESYGDHRVYFCYVHVGAEVARVEMPEWVALDDTLRNAALEMMITQVQKGYGYPVALAEAHNQAVVRGGDRTRFFALLEREMIRVGLQNVGTSYKEARKRGSIA
ncbi:DNA double-strand break repair nuclease NurA [Oscillatoria sp. CS-180]|uniref:DNA double-strand break repair nuclease NurA n=1 Tax=Oscillatoria sp. CS-180 TaxID=3021720 RepID=UPI00232E5821|nr:DNA double-strand break repair nuclease NurA [Oscillatoria sp. CS-180]MDB9525681.1 DNA double-strand break repair nuclease NurA [Oscillatoria sp. CS-180]